jgi:hypothetical protein
MSGAISGATLTPPRISLRSSGLRSLPFQDGALLRVIAAELTTRSAFTANARLRANPGAEWRYTNCNFILLSRLIRDAVGGDARRRKNSSRANCSRRSASSMPPSNTTAPASRSARFTSGPAPATGHASACCTARRRRGERSAPAARRLGRLLGSQGQYTIVIPSHDLVIVKLGWTYTPHDDHVAVKRLVRETIAARCVRRISVSVIRHPLCSTSDSILFSKNESESRKSARDNS